MAVIRRFDFIRDVEPLFNITFPNGETLDITPCTKGEYEHALHELVAAQKAIKATKTDEDADAALGELYEIAAGLASHNTARKTITADELRGTYDINNDRLIGFFYAYADYANEIHNLKN